MARSTSGSKQAVTTAPAPFVASAPQELIDFYEASGGVRRELLGRLLRDKPMARIWARIEEIREEQFNARGSAFPYSALWGAIQTAFSRANRAERTRKNRKKPRHITQQQHARKAAALAAKLVAHVSKDDSLNYLAHTLFPDNVERLTGRAAPDRNLHKTKVSLAHTTLVELLNEFQKRATDSTRIEPLVKRVRARAEAHKDVRPTTFVLELDDIFFKHRVSRPMHSVIATIANVALDLPNYNKVTDDYVRKLLSRKKRT